MCGTFRSAGWICKMLRIRNAAEEDLPAVMRIYRLAQDFMIASGNPDQWGHFYPPESVIRADIREGRCRVITEENVIHGVFSVLDGGDPDYRRIEDGGWLNDEPYLTILRIAGDGCVHGLFSCAADYCKALSDNVRVDTHRDNWIMQKLITKNGFKRCGTVFVRESPRIAYHWSRGS